VQKLGYGKIKNSDNSNICRRDISLLLFVSQEFSRKKKIEKRIKSRIGECVNREFSLFEHFLERDDSLEYIDIDIYFKFEFFMRIREREKETSLDRERYMID